ncbi:restriction endonuclease subunit S [Bacillus cereus]|uniref:restriction endonuclease subunit S n=1 Tax=Bacillus cereus TaxID=1396 RepID=UPI003879948B
MKNKYTPEIRFAGYTGNWDEYKLGDIAEKVSVGIATSSSQYFSNKNQGIPFIKNQNVKENWIDSSDLEYISKEFDQANATKRVREGDILTVRTGYPGMSAVVPKELEGAQTFTTLITRLKKDTAIPEFISAFINSATGMKQILGMEAGGAQKNVNAGILKNLLIQLPSLDEQKKVSSFIKDLSNTIALHQQELDILKQTKQGFLQKMFPKEGKSVPEVRFPGFTRDWEQRKLNEVAEIIGGGTPSTAIQEYWGGDIDWYSPVEIGKETYAFGSQRKITTLGLRKSSAKVLPANKTILFTSRAGIGDMAILKKDGATNQGFQSLVVNNNYDIYFVYSIGYKIKEFALKHASGSTFLEISAKGLGKMDLFVPSLEEQIKIGNLFKQLDDFIALYQRELDALKEMKKAFLQKMFV